MARYLAGPLPLPAIGALLAFGLAHDLQDLCEAGQQARALRTHGLAGRLPLHLVVEDDGRGFDPSQQQAGVGLRSVRARAAYLGGTLEVQ